MAVVFDLMLILKKCRYLGYIKKLFRNEQLFYCKKLRTRLVWPEDSAAAFDFMLNFINDCSVYGKNKKMHRHLLSFIYQVVE